MLMNFHFLQENRKYRGWAPRGTKSLITESFTDFNMSFLLAFSSRDFYCIVVNKGTSDQNIFMKFLDFVLESRK